MSATALYLILICWNIFSYAVVRFGLRNRNFANFYLFQVLASLILYFFVFYVYRDTEIGYYDTFTLPVIEGWYTDTVSSLNIKLRLLGFKLEITDLLIVSFKTGVLLIGFAGLIGFLLNSSLVEVKKHFTLLKEMNTRVIFATVILTAVIFFMSYLFEDVSSASTEIALDKPIIINFWYMSFTVLLIVATPIFLLLLFSKAEESHVYVTTYFCLNILLFVIVKCTAMYFYKHDYSNFTGMMYFFYQVAIYFIFIRKSRLAFLWLSIYPKLFLFLTSCYFYFLSYFG